MDKERRPLLRVFQAKKKKKSKISEAKMRARIFVGSQIKQIFEYHDFSTYSTERRPWKAS
jgi:hypothetical protein